MIIDYDTLVSILKAKEKTLLRTLPKVLESYYHKDQIHTGADFIYVEGDLPVALVAHLDTVHSSPPVWLFHDSTKEILWTPEGLGADDRAGVYGILMLVMEGHRPSIIFTTGEEQGGKGAINFLSQYPNPLVETNFLIELDRQGFNDAVYYDCDNPEFERYINSYGFYTAIGIFSDISFIAPKWGIAAVNLSIGYFNEHTTQEYLCYSYTQETIEKVNHILESDNTEKFYYKEKDELWHRDEEIWQSST